MSKSIKLKDNNYLDSSSVVHNKIPLNSFLNGKLGCYDTTLANISSDLDNLQPGQTVYWGTSTELANKPTTGGRCYCIYGYGNYEVQIAFKYNADYIYIRHRWSSAWSEWRQI